MKGGDLHEAERAKASQAVERRRGRRGGALRREDALYGRLNIFRSQVARAERIIAKALAITAPWSVSFSGGKDSTVLLDLVRHQAPDCPAVFVDSGAEYPETLEFVVSTPNVITIQAGMSLLDMYRTTGMFGREAEMPDTHWRAGHIKDTMIITPLRYANQEYGFVGNFDGLRAEESAGRKKMASARPRVWLQVNGIYRCEPLMDWGTQDIWSYICSRELAYNAVYDILAELDVPRDKWRVAPFAGGSAIGRGRWAILKQGWPDLFNRFAAEFPDVRCYV